jgi:5-methylcytosine-specific restriction endonuclease McrA
VIEDLLKELVGVFCFLALMVAAIALSAAIEHAEDRKLRLRDRERRDEAKRLAQELAARDERLICSLRDSNERLYITKPQEWAVLRRRVLERDGHKCQMCGACPTMLRSAYCLAHELHIHHVVALSEGGTNRLENLQTLCRGCHMSIHPRLADSALDRWGEV